MGQWARRAAVELSVGGRVVARYVPRPDVHRSLSPRPYLHPVRTLGGEVVSEVLPDDHPHHLGVSLGVQDVDGTNLWGGRTYVRGTGYTWLDDHGRIVHDEFTERADDRFVERLRWCDPTDRTLLTEERALAVGEVPGRPGAWVLDIRYSLAAPDGRDVTLGSPVTNGRPDPAGYGGFFWRAPLAGTPPEVFTASAAGEADVNGSSEAWVAMVRPSFSLLFTGLGRDDRWFVRATGYPGVCAALAFERPRTVPARRDLRRHHRVAVVDGPVGTDEAGALAATLAAGAGSGATG